MNKIVNNPWVVVLALLSMVWWVIENKDKIPDEIEPVMMLEAQGMMAPLQEQTNYQVSVTAEQSIKYHNQNICDGVATDLVALSQAYRMYQAARNQAHPYATMSRPEICEDRRIRNLARQK